MQPRSFREMKQILSTQVSQTRLANDFAFKMELKCLFTSEELNHKSTNSNFVNIKTVFNFDKICFSESSCIHSLQKACMCSPMCQQKNFHCKKRKKKTMTFKFSIKFFLLVLRLENYQCWVNVLTSVEIGSENGSNSLFYLCTYVHIHFYDNYLFYKLSEEMKSKSNKAGLNNFRLK